MTVPYEGVVIVDAELEEALATRISMECAECEQVLFDPVPISLSTRRDEAPEGFVLCVPCSIEREERLLALGLDE